MIQGQIDSSVQDWLAGEVAEYKDRLPAFRRLEQVLGEQLRAAVKDVAPEGIVQTRAKSIASFTEKCLRKRHKYPHPALQLTDLCGGRVIVPTRGHVAHISEYLEERFEIDWENSLDAAKRLKLTEFGYRSIHYVLSLRRDVDYAREIPEHLYRLKAEIQVRTIVEHAYATIAHDLTYKGEFEPPDAWKRELAGVAAALEEADQTFSRIEGRLSTYATSYGAYLDDEQLAQEVALLRVVLEHVPGNAELAARLGKLAITRGDWSTAIDVLSRFVSEDEKSTRHEILRDLGIALCKAHGPTRATAERSRDNYRLGQRYLQLAIESDPSDADALASYAGTWKQIDEEKAREYYRRAFEVDPTDPYPLGNYLECELPDNPAILGPIDPLIRQAIERCEAYFEVGVNMPWALYDMGKFQLLRGRPYDSVDSYARALSVSSAPFMVETSLASIDRIARVKVALPGLEWIRLLLLLGLAARFDERMVEVQGLATRGHQPIVPPVVIVAGGTDPRVEERMHEYSTILLEAFEAFEGTIISGGTKQGISGLVGQVGERYRDRIRTIGYVPRPDTLPEDASLDERYTEVRHTSGDGFTPFEPIQSWIDVISSGIPPKEVRVIGINGGRIAAAEYRIALALGATVGVIAESGREAGKLLANPRWASTERLVSLPGSTRELKAFIEAHSASASV